MSSSDHEIGSAASAGRRPGAEAAGRRGRLHRDNRSCV